MNSDHSNRLAKRFYGAGARLALSKRPHAQTTATRHFARAAALGDLDALWACAHRIRYGRGEPRNLRLGFLILHRAAELGHATAQYSVGVCFAFGEGVRKDRKKAFQWYRLAARTIVATPYHILATIIVAVLVVMLLLICKRDATKNVTPWAIYIVTGILPGILLFFTWKRLLIGLDCLKSAGAHTPERNDA